jgi:hypothetical protein
MVPFRVLGPARFITLDLMSQADVQVLGGAGEELRMMYGTSSTQLNQLASSSCISPYGEHLASVRQ